MAYRPQIITSTNELTNLTPSVGGRTAVIMGTATWGSINTVTSISSLSNFISLFGDDKTGTGVTGIKGADLFLTNGGNLLFVRVEDGTAAKADYMGQNGSTNVLNFEAKYKGSTGNNITVTVEAISSSRSVIITNGSIVERYTNGTVGYSTNADIATAINSSSQLVVATAQTNHTITDLVDAFSITQLTGGSDGDSTISQTHYENAYDAVLSLYEYNFLLIPGYSDNTFQNSFLGRINLKASTEKKYSRYISGVSKDETITTMASRTLTGMRVSLVSPSVKYTHRIDKTSIILDGSYLACAYAGMLCSTDLEVSGTHETITVPGLSVNSSTGQEYYSKVEQEQLLTNRINPISLIGNTIQSARAVTRVSDKTSVYFEEVIVDIVDTVVADVESYLNSVIGKPNTAERREIYASRINAILTIFKNQGIIEEYNDTIVEEGDSPDTIEATVSIKPTYNTNFIYLTINIS